MYNNQINNPNFLTHVRAIPDVHAVQAEDLHKQDDAGTEDSVEPAHITVVPFSTTKTGSFQ